MRLFIFSTTLLLFCLFGSCSESNNVKDVFYKNGNIKSREYYKGKYISYKFKSIDYFENGIVKDTNYYNNQGKLDGQCYQYDSIYEASFRSKYINGLKDGWSKVNFRNGKSFKRPFVNDTALGIQYSYNSDGVLESEHLWVDNTVVAIKMYETLYPGDTIFAKYTIKGRVNDSITSRVVKDTIEHCIISLLDTNGHKKKMLGYLDLKKNKVDTLSSYNSYPVLQITDTIKNGSPLSLRVRLLDGNYINKNLKMVLFVGKLDKELNFCGKVSVCTVENGYSEFQFKIDEYKIGYNVIMGILEIYNGEKFIHSVLVFDDYTVLP